MKKILLTAIANVGCALIFIPQLRAQTLHFTHAFIYEYAYNNDTNQLWIFHHPEKEMLLYHVHQDDMVEAVISYPDGTYRTYYTDYNGNKLYEETVITQVTESWIKPIEVSACTPNVQRKFSIDGIERKSACIDIQYRNADKEQLLFIDNIKGNAHQLYGFHLVAGDGSIRLPINYMHFLNKNQWLAQVDNPYFQLKLIAYEYNPYEIDISKYKKNKR